MRRAIHCIKIVLLILQNRQRKKNPRNISWAVCFASLGQFINYVDRILKKFDHPWLTSLLHKLVLYPWNLANTLFPLSCQHSLWTAHLRMILCSYEYTLPIYAFKACVACLVHAHTSIFCIHFFVYIVRIVP